MLRGEVNAALQDVGKHALRDDFDFLQVVSRNYFITKKDIRNIEAK